MAASHPVRGLSPVIVVPLRQAMPHLRCKADGRRADGRSHARGSADPMPPAISANPGRLFVIAVKR
jgi:hypothetical protein